MMSRRYSIPGTTACVLVSYLLLSGGVSVVRADGDLSEMNDDGLKFFVSPTGFCNGGVSFTRSEQDLSFKVQIGGGPETDSPPFSTFNVPFKTPFRIFNWQSSLEFLPFSLGSSKQKQLGETPWVWLVEEENRRGDIQVGRFEALMLEGVHRISDNFLFTPMPVKDRDALHQLEKECIFGAGILPRDL